MNEPARGAFHRSRTLLRVVKRGFILAQVIDPEPSRVADFEQGEKKP